MYLHIWDQVWPEKPLILLAGPRQAGKTTLARDLIARTFADSLYFNWDFPTDKARLLADPAFFTAEPRRNPVARPLVILDEWHKYRHWKNYLKGIYDRFSRDYQFLVTGSGRLEYSRKIGDSLAGRFLRLHLFPFTVAELGSSRMPWPAFRLDPLGKSSVDAKACSDDVFETLWECGGFPEPFTKGRKTFWRQWSRSYGQQIVRDDLQSVADLRNLDLVESLYALLPSKVGSPLSINSLAQDLQVTFDTVKNWLLLFDAFSLTFRIAPWSSKIARSLLKEKKIYLFNLPLIDDPGARLENLVALELLRAIETWNDLGYGDFSLHYLRNKEKQEVDFLLADHRKPFLLLETKAGDDRPAESLKAFQNILDIPAVQLTLKEDVRKFFRNGRNDLLVTTACTWLSRLP
jgi:uncharacterized protein